MDWSELTGQFILNDKKSYGLLPRSESIAGTGREN
jgi:hypothetical protein